MMKQLTLTFFAVLLSIASFALSPITGPHTVCVGSNITLMDSTAGGAWSSSNTAIATIGSAGNLHGVSAGVVTITYAMGSIVTYSVTVNPLPAAITGPTTVAAGSFVTLADATPGGAWASGCPAIMTISGSGMLSGISAGTCFITYTLSTGCYVTRMDTVTGTGGGTAGPITGTTHVCAGSTTTLLDSTAGGTWSSSNTAIATVGATTGVVTGVAAGVCTITYTVGTSTATTSFTVNPLPAAITGPTTVAVGSGITLSDATSGGSWISSNPSIATVNATSGLVTGVSAGTVTIYYQLSTGCARFYSVTVTGSSVLPITGSFSLCVGSITILHDSTTGGTWSSSNTSIATVNGTNGTVTGVAAGTCTITYTVGTSIVTALITVNPLPAAISGPTTVPVGITIALTDATTGGTWISSNTSVATVNPTTGVVTGVSAGTVTIYYQLPTGCARSYTITVTGTTVLPISGPSQVCLGNTIALTDSTSGGIWTSSNTSIATVGATSGVVSGVTAGTCTITYTVGTSFVTKSITVNPLPATPSGSSSVAAGSSIVLTDATPGGTWYSSNTAIATVTGAGVVTGITGGSVLIYYSLPTGCSSSKLVTVTSTSVLPITGNFTPCIGSTTTLHDSTAGGTWSSSNTAIATIGSSTGVLTAVAVGSCTITYTVGTSIATHTVTVFPLPAAISGPSTVAAGSTITLTDASTGGTWTSSNTSIATVNATTGVVTGVSAGSVTIYYQLGGSGCATSRTLTVTGALTLLPIFGTFHACIGSSSTLFDSTSGGTWSSSNTAIATVGATTGVVVGVSAGTCTITYTVGTSIVTASFTVDAIPGAISGPTTVATGSTILLTDPTPGGTWLSGNTTRATVNPTTGVVTGVSAGTVNIYYTTPGGCGVFFTITVTGTSSYVLPITGTFSVCVGSSVTLYDSTSGGTWSSSNPSVATVGGTTGVVVGVAAGACTITYTVGSTSVTHSFTVNPLPAAITGTGTLCVGTSITLSDLSPGGSWLSGNTTRATVGTTSGVVTAVSAGTVNIYYQLPTGCGASKTITVNAAPAAIGGSGSVCVGSTITLTDATSGGTWSSVYTAIATVSSTGVVFGVTPGATNIAYSLGGCSVYKSVTVNTAPAAITGSSNVCVGASITMSDATAGGTWSTSATSIAPISTGGVVTGSASGTANIYYTVGGCSVYKIVTVNPMPAAIAGSSTVHTGGAPITLTDAVSGGSWFSGNPSLASVGALTGVVTGVSAGTVNIFYSIGGCAVYKTITVLSPAPPPAFDPTSVTPTADLTPADIIENGSAVSADQSTGVKTVTNDKNFSLYPNPTSGGLSIAYDNQVNGMASIMVTDVIGREVIKTSVDLNQGSGIAQINLSSLRDGMYIITINSEASSFSGRIVVKH